MKRQVTDDELLAKLPVALPGRDRDREAIARTWELMRRAILTLDSLPGKKREQLVTRLALSPPVNEERYRFGEPLPERFVPSPRDVSNMLPVLAWICKRLREHKDGDRDFRLMLARARGAPWWKLANFHGRCERTLQRWIDGAVTDIYFDNRTEFWELERGVRQ